MESPASNCLMRSRQSPPEPGFRGPGNGAEMLEQAFLGRLVIVWSHLKAGIGAELFRFSCQIDRLLGGISTRAGHHLDPPGGKFNSKPDHLEMLVVIQSRGFAGRADGDNAVHLAANLELNEFLERIHVQSIIRKGCHQSGVCTGQQLIFHRKTGDNFGE